ncbi:SIR2 family protein [Pseudomonas sp. GW456-L15]|uniref:SIR2 family protein n=1 Tax=Pseudomonas sp. GW456-L15 TaxID=2751353 RepID=UPI001A918A01|nr:SIR2 family protein [Pseudomonas sp. GW456-L15]
MISWPESLIQELASRRAIIFLGAGISAGSTARLNNQCRPPDWNTLLSTAAEKFKKNDSDFIRKLIDSNKLLDAAEVIFHNVPVADKRNFFVAQFATPDFQPAEYHEIIQSINPKIVITTNYDQIYEKQCDALLAGHGYSVRKFHDDDLLDCVRSSDNLIIKAHGCISSVNNIVLNRSDYFSLKKQYAGFYSVLDSLLTVSTVLFLGCSMSDPDIQLVLENTNISAPSSHTHYAVMSKGGHAALNSAMESAYNIKILEYDSADGHAELIESLKDLNISVEALRTLVA